MLIGHGAMLIWNDIKMIGHSGMLIGNGVI